MEEDYDYESRLHELISQGLTLWPTREAWQDSILTYLTQSCTVTESYKKAPSSNFVPSPLPINVVPKTALAKELKVVENGCTALVLALRLKAPSSVIAALCQLNPKSVSTKDENGALPLHIATLRPSGRDEKVHSVGTEALKTLGVLADIYPPGLVSRDRNGKTPLHWLLDHYPETRNVSIVELLSKPVDERVWRSDIVQSQLYFRRSGQKRRVDVPMPTILKRKSPETRTTANIFTPASALIIPDSIYGCIPLHYAVMNGASKEVVKNMVKDYPSSVSKSDCMGRTPLHWHFGAGGDATVSGDIVDPETGRVKKVPPIHHTYRSSHMVTILMHKDPSFTFNVARMHDIDKEGNPHRVPLHYAIELIAKSMLDPPPEDKMAITRKNTEQSGNVNKEEPTEAKQSCLSFKVLKFLFDQCPHSLGFQDSNGQTPLHVLFRTISEWNNQQYIKAMHIVQTGSNAKGVPKEPKIFVPPMELIELLMQKVDPKSDTFDGSAEDHYEVDEDDPVSAVMVTDERGLLPLHLAVLAVTAPKILNVIIEANPTGLIQASFEEERKRGIDPYDYTSPNANFSKEVKSPIPCFLGGRTPLHMAFASPFVSRLHSDSTLGPLLFFNFSSKQGEENVENTGGARVLIDGTVVLRMKDAGGNTPLHLAALNNSSLTIMRILLKCYPDAVTERNADGDLPLHLLMDRNNIFISAQLALAHSKKPEVKQKMGELFSDDHSRELRGKVRELAKRQTVALRMSQFRLGGAVFAPTTGWTSDDAEMKRRRGRHETLLKVNLLAKVLIHDEACLKIAGSTHGMTPLHIVVAFRALPYKSLHIMLQNAPETARAKTLPDSYTPLDLHCVRDKIPGEISEGERKAWTAIRQMLFSYEAFPLENVASLDQIALQRCRLDEDFLESCKDQILSEIKPSLSEAPSTSMHMESSHPTDPDHEKFGFTKDENIIVYAVPNANKNINFSDVVSRLWTFLAMFSNMDDKKDHYASYVEGVLRELDFDKLQDLVNKNIPPFTYSDSLAAYSSDKIIRDYANPYCKAVIHSFYYFAGLYDFKAPISGSSILLRKKRSSVVIEAMEHSFNADSGNDKLSKKSDGKDSEFKISQRMVCIKFMKDRPKYKKELMLHSALSSCKEGFAPILAHYDATNMKRGTDRQYASDIKDQRFRQICTRLNSFNSSDYVEISQYPYAIVYPATSDYTINDALLRGTFEPSLGRQVCFEMGSALQNLHEKSLIHGHFSLRQVGCFHEQDENGKVLGPKWKLLDLESSIPFVAGQASQGNCLGLIESDGSVNFESVSFPPEMFVKLETHGLNLYETYWKAVMENDNVDIPEEIIKPRIDSTTGDAYVMKCHYDGETELPPLPYDLVAPSKSVDVWAFGVMLYNVLSGGETLFRSNISTGQTVSYYELANWDIDTAETMVKQCVSDVAAQDLLLHILVPDEERQELDMGTILSHPYFSMADNMPQEVVDYLEDMRDEREAESNLRKQQANDEREAQERKERTTIVASLSVKSRLKIANSTSGMMNEAFGTRDLPIKVPYSYLILPYKLSFGNNGKLVPSSKEDFELGEKLGRNILDVMKTLCFVSYFNDTYNSSALRQDFMDQILGGDPEQVIEDTLFSLKLDAEQYATVASKFMAFVVDPDINFVSDSTNMFKMLIQEKMAVITSLYEGAGRSYLYLVDEYFGTPLANGKYPHVFKGHVVDIMYKGFPFMYTCIKSACASAGDVSGLVRLFFEGAYPHTPPSWSVVAKGIDFSLKRSHLYKEATFLRDILSESIREEKSATSNTIEDLQFFENLVLHIDSEKSFGGLRPVTDTVNMIWTSETGVRALKEESRRNSDPTKLETMLRDTTQPKRINPDDAKIAELESKIVELQTLE